MKCHVLVSIFLLSTALCADDWPQFLGPTRDGVAPKGAAIPAWTAKGPPLVWQKSVGPAFAGPVLAGGKLILFHRVQDQEVVEALDPADGKTLWTFAYETSFTDDFGKGDGPRSTPAIAGNRVVTLGADGGLHVVSLADGKKIWGRQLLKEYAVPPSYFGVGTSPIVVDGLVLINVGAKDAGIVAFELETGKEAWKATGDGASYSSPIVVGKQAVFFTRNGVVTLESKTGKVLHTQRWRARIDASVNAATPIAVGADTVFFSTSYDTGALVLKLKDDGAQELWSGEEVMDNHYNTCVLHGKLLYGIHGRQEVGASLRCADPISRKVHWTQEKFGCASLIAVGDQLVMLTEKGDLVLAEASPREYKELARARVLGAGAVRAPAALADGMLFLRDRETLKCLKLR